MPERSFLAGFIVVDKPAGETSFAMVSMLRRLTGVRRIGHAGTLDPLATGVLPVAVGAATRLIGYMEDAPKGYVAEARLGIATDTYDADGAVTSERDASGITQEAVASALAGFVGAVLQRPPPFSAIKLAGKPLYRYAREGARVEAPARTVRIDSIELRAFEPPVVQIAVQCRKGTYIRSIAHDLGERLGCGAHVTSLRRTSSGGFALDDAHDVGAIATAAAEGALDELMLAPDRVLESRQAAIVGDLRAAELLQGRDLELDGRASGPICRAYSTEGEFLGVLRALESGAWHTEKVLRRAS